MSDFQNISTAVEDGILIISLNRPQAMNALNRTLLTELNEAVNQLYSDDDIKGCIVTGVGDKAFAAGADIAEFKDYPLNKARNMARFGHNIFNRLESSPKPTIAAVNGYALGGGCELAMACQMRIASEAARFGQPEVNLGLIPGYGGTQRLVQLIGKGKAIELLMTADMVKADEAKQLGLVNHVVPAEELMSKAKEIINKIATKAPLAIAKIVRAVDAHFDGKVDGFAEEINLFAESFETEDFKEGTAAFLEKRKADFKGK